MAEAEMDELYRARPDEFTALRTRLSSAAKQHGDVEAAKRIAAARRPTVAAWVVNQLVYRNPEARQRLTELGERLRAAHAAMDGGAIRTLSREQRRLVDELSRTAFSAAELPDPSATVREDVAASLQAAIADPEVAARLGRLVKAEQWAGFGEFELSTTVSESKGQPRPATDEARAKQARTALTEAQHAKAEADELLAERQTELATARLRLDDARDRLQQAERDLRAADEAYNAARSVSRNAAQLVKDATARLVE